MGVSERTLRYKRKDFVTVQYEYNKEISDNLLDDLVRGERMILGAIKVKGFNIQRERVRRSLNRVNPDRNALSRGIRRRVYNVPGPNCLW